MFLHTEKQDITFYDDESWSTLLFWQNHWLFSSKFHVNLAFCGVPCLILWLDIVYAENKYTKTYLL